MYMFITQMGSIDHVNHGREGSRPQLGLLLSILLLVFKCSSWSMPQYALSSLGSCSSRSLPTPRCLCWDFSHIFIGWDDSWQIMGNLGKWNRGGLSPRSLNWTWRCWYLLVRGLSPILTASTCTPSALLLRQVHRGSTVQWWQWSARLRTWFGW